MKVDVAIIGAGLAGLTAARILIEAGKTVVILEKSRGLGGRAATRRVEEIPVDHGAQFFTARSPEFCAEVAKWQELGWCFVWAEGFHRWAGGELHPPDETTRHPRYACRAGMSTLGKALAVGLPVEREHLVSEVARENGIYTLLCAGGQTVQAGMILSTAPPPQTLAMLEGFLPTENHERLQHLAVAPCLAAIVDLGSADVAWQGIQIEGEDLSWIGADFTKREPTPTRRLAVLHAGADFSRTHLDADLDAAGSLMLEAAAKYDPAFRQATLLQVHRWRFARVEHPLRDWDYFSDGAEGRIFVAGDAFLSGHLESAWLSGTRVARAMLAAE